MVNYMTYFGNLTDTSPVVLLGNGHSPASSTKGTRWQWGSHHTICDESSTGDGISPAHAQCI